MSSDTPVLVLLVEAIPITSCVVFILGCSAEPVNIAINRPSP